MATLEDQLAAFIAALGPDIKAALNNNVVSAASSAAPTPSGSGLRNYLFLTALATNTTIGAPSGTIKTGASLVIRIKDNGTARTITWNTVFRPIGVSLPSTTVAGKIMYIGAFYNEVDQLWDVSAFQVQA